VGHKETGKWRGGGGSVKDGDRAREASRFNDTSRVTEPAAKKEVGGGGEEFRLLRINNPILVRQETIWELSGIPGIKKALIKVDVRLFDKELRASDGRGLHGRGELTKIDKNL